MSGNTFGKIFSVTTFGESHGEAMGCIIDGCPPNFEIKNEDIQMELDRRKPGQSDVTTQRKEDDKVEIMSGVFEGKTLGTPIALLIRNEDQISKDYSNIKDTFRPKHATSHIKQSMVLEITEVVADQAQERQQCELLRSSC
ncbi:MAG: hypothetical protein Ct9H90mP6_07810 [Gammaproteobacteria bacterium]|nr:MAG: hypothetical protein Ct9H90mP6_07810 [Gammaproteobacteria bacterium]